MLPNGGEGGMQRIVARLAEAQRSSGHEVAVAASPGIITQPLFGEPRFDIPSVTRSPASIAAAAGVVRRITRSWSPQVVHGHSARLAPVISLATSAGRRRPALISVHGMPEETVPAVARGLRLARLPVVAVGPGLGAALEQHGLACRVVPNGVSPPPPPADRASLRREWDIPDGASLLLAVGRLVPQKNHLVAVKALAHVPDAVLVILGDGPLRESLEQEAALLGVDDRLRLPGFRPDARAIMAAVDVVVMPSVWEGLPAVALEALGARAPLIAAATPGLKDWLTDGVDALLVPPHDPEMLGRAVLRLIHERNLVATLARGGARTFEQHTEKAMAENYSILYTELVERHRRKSDAVD